MKEISKYSTEEKAEILIAKKIRSKPITGPYRNMTAKECAIEDCNLILEGIEEYKDYWLRVKEHIKSTP